MGALVGMILSVVLHTSPNRERYNVNLSAAVTGDCGFSDLLEDGAPALPVRCDCRIGRVARLCGWPPFNVMKSAVFDKRTRRMRPVSLRLENQIARRGAPSVWFCRH